MKKFLRQDVWRYSRLGDGRKRLQRWRKPKGRDSKMRIKRRSYPASPTIGHKSCRKEAGKINGLTPVLVHNIHEVDKLNKNSIAILAKVGAKKKLEILKHAEDKKIKILNIGGKNETPRPKGRGIQ